MAKNLIKFLAYGYFFRNFSSCIYKDTSVQTARISSTPPQFSTVTKKPSLETVNCQTRKGAVPRIPSSDTSEHIHTRVVAQDSLNNFKPKLWCCTILVAERYVIFSSRKVKGWSRKVKGWSRKVKGWIFSQNFGFYKFWIFSQKLKSENMPPFAATSASPAF